jgi:RNA polymerase sigma-70 factor (ECF subfamily)
MADLPPRQRAILLAARVDGLSRREIASHYRISVRLVQRELQEAQKYCAARLKRVSPVSERSNQEREE